jgi:hypothetical protein
MYYGEDQFEMLATKNAYAKLTTIEIHHALTSFGLVITIQTRSLARFCELRNELVTDDATIEVKTNSEMPKKR